MLAVKRLGWTTVPTRIAATLDDALLAILAQRDENTCRKALAPTEYVKQSERIEKAFSATNAQKQKSGKSEDGKAGGRGKAKNLPENFRKVSHDKPTHTSRVAAAVAGVSSRTHEKAKAVVKAAEKEPEKFAKIQEQMDKTGKVDPAFRKLQDAQRAEESRVKAEAARKTKQAAVPLVVQSEFQVRLPTQKTAKAIITDPPYGAESLPLPLRIRGLKIDRIRSSWNRSKTADDHWRRSSGIGSPVSRSRSRAVSTMKSGDSATGRISSCTGSGNSRQTLISRQYRGFPNVFGAWL